MNVNSSHEGQMAMAADGTLDRVLRKRPHCSTYEARPPMAIFIHAGAGYHSLQNENVHLSICSKYNFLHHTVVAIH